MSTVARIPLMILSFVLSLILWGYVQQQEKPPKDPNQSYKVKVTLKGKRSDVMILKDPGEIQVFPLGPKEELERIKQEDLSAFIDLPDSNASGTYPVHLIYSGDALVKWGPPVKQATVLLDEIKTKPTLVPIDVQVYGGVNNSDYLYVPSQTVVEPPVVSVSGPASVIATVTRARAVLDLSRVVAGKPELAKVELLRDDGGQVSNEGVIISPDTVTVRAGIAIAPQLRTLHVMPVFKGQPAPGFFVKEVHITPEDVQVRGNTQSLVKLLYLAGKEPIDISGLKASKSFQFVPELPIDVYLSAPGAITVDVIIEPQAPPVSPPVDPVAKKPKRRGGE